MTDLKWSLITKKTEKDWCVEVYRGIMRGKSRRGAQDRGEKSRDEITE